MQLYLSGNPDLAASFFEDEALTIPHGAVSTGADDVKLMASYLATFTGMLFGTLKLNGFSLGPVDLPDAKNVLPTDTVNNTPGTLEIIFNSAKVVRGNSVGTINGVSQGNGTFAAGSNSIIGG